MTVAILGGTGAFGSALAGRLRRLGEEVVIGSRTPDGVETFSHEEAVRRGDLVVLSVPPDGVECVRPIADALDGKILLSVASPVVFRDGQPVVEAGPRSLAEIAAEAAPGARVVAGFHTVSASALAGDGPVAEDVLLAGDDADAKAEVAALAERIVMGRAIDAGRLEAARWLETLTALLININRNYHSETGVRITGL